jgi:4,5-DOPA dioxygenase extradiol
VSSVMHDEKMPAVFLSHGAPTLADDETWTKELASWGAKLPVPRSILVVSAHWEAAPLTIAATTPVPLFYDFSGFPRHYYNVRYDAPGAPGLAESVTKLLSGPGASVHQDPGRGLDHGAYVPLMEMYPDADIPVLQISMPTLDPAALFEVGRKLAPLRDEGVLILGSGFSTHNLQQAMNRMAGSPSDTPPTWSSEFDDWLQRTLSDGDIDALIDFQSRAPAAALAHPRTEHFAPLFVTLGTVANDTVAPETAIDGFWYGLSKRSIQFA